MPGFTQHYCLDIVDKALRSLFPPECTQKATIRARINFSDHCPFECDVHAPAEYAEEIAAALQERFKGFEFRLVVRSP